MQKCSVKKKSNVKRSALISNIQTINYWNLSTRYKNYIIKLCIVQRISRIKLNIIKQAVISKFKLFLKSILTSHYSTFSMRNEKMIFMIKLQLTRVEINAFITESMYELNSISRNWVTASSSKIGHCWAFKGNCTLIGNCPKVLL